MSGTGTSSDFFHIIEPPRACSYLPDQTASLEFRGFSQLMPEQLERLIVRGWRRFGVQVFRPRCPKCSRCVPVRINVREFQPSKSQRRVLRRNADVRVTLTKATLTPQHLSLYNLWHREMSDLRNWPQTQASFEDYISNFLTGDFPSCHELKYFRGGKLIGVGLIDLLPHSISSAYFYHDPEWRPLGPGTFSLLCEIDLARQRGLDDVYLGYWIAECPSMAYKNRFRPYERLIGWPNDDEEPEWSTANE